MNNCSNCQWDSTCSFLVKKEDMDGCDCWRVPQQQMAQCRHGVVDPTPQNPTVKNILPRGRVRHQARAWFDLGLLLLT